MLNVLGITGKYCAGKNFIASLLEKKGIPVLDADKFGHKVIENERKAILDYFGTGILGLDGLIDRKKLAFKTFGNHKALLFLENTIHPGVIKLTDEWIKEQKTDFCVINAALLHRWPFFNKLKIIILVEAPLLTRIQRAHRRDNLSYRAIFKRLNSQKEFNSKYFSGNTDIYRVWNRGFGSVSVKSRKRLLNRLNEILSRLGIG